MIQQSVSRRLSIVSGNFKYITPGKSERIDLNTHIELWQDTIPQLYNLKDDAGERKNIAYEICEGQRPILNIGIYKIENKIHIEYFNLAGYCRKALYQGK